MIISLFQVHGFSNNFHKSFTSRKKALAFLSEHGITNHSSSAAPAKAASPSAAAAAPSPPAEAGPYAAAAGDGPELECWYDEFCGGWVHRSLLDQQLKQLSRELDDGHGIHPPPSPEAAPVSVPPDALKQQSSAPPQPAAAAQGSSSPPSPPAHEGPFGPLPKPWVVNIDGFCSEENELGAAAVVRIGGREVLSISQPIDHSCCGDQAMYAAGYIAVRAVRALLWGVQRGEISIAPPETIIIKSESRDFVRQLSEGGPLEDPHLLQAPLDELEAEETGLLHELRRLGGWAKAARWPKGTPELCWRHVPRSRNQRAEGLVYAIINGSVPERSCDIYFIDGDDDMSLHSIVGDQRACTVWASDVCAAAEKKNGRFKNPLIT